MKNLIFSSITLMLFAQTARAQEWSLKLSSNVELRNWTLTNKADKKEKTLQGATITLYKGAVEIGQTTSDGNGDFVIDIPAHGDFILTISYGGCNTKKFYVSTNGVPENVGKDNYKPTIVIGGFVLSKPITGVDYIGLNDPLVKVEYKAGGQNFDKDDDVTSRGLSIVSKISAAETAVIDKFCLNNKLGDEALNKKKCELAKEYYLKARAILPDETYPIEKLEKAEECLNEKKAKQEAAAEEAAKKAELARLANEKAIKEKEARNNAAFKKEVKEPVAPKETEKQKSSAKITQPEPSGNSSDKMIKVKTGSTQSEKGNSGGGGKSKYKMPAVMGADKYKQAITKADDYFKTKRYKDAKASYEEALKHKANDVYATGRIEQCNKLTQPDK